MSQKHHSFTSYSCISSQYMRPPKSIQQQQTSLLPVRSGQAKYTAPPSPSGKGAYNNSNKFLSKKMYFYNMKSWNCNITTEILYSHTKNNNFFNIFEILAIYNIRKVFFPNTWQKKFNRFRRENSNNLTYNRLN